MRPETGASMITALLLSTAATLVSPPAFSKPGGFYDEPISVELSAAPDAVIHYTLDGATPTRDSPAYSAPLTIDAPVDPGPLSRIDTTGTGTWKPPARDAPRAVVVTARAFRSSDASLVAAHTYWVGRDPPAVAVVSLATDARHWFEPDHGIYVAGRDRARSFHRRGADRERPVHVEVFDSGGSRLAGLPAGVRLHGFSARVAPQKSLRVYARKRYGVRAIETPVFASRGEGRVKRMLLRTGGQDRAGHSADVLAATLMAGTHVDTQAWRPAVVYVNGEYWGVHHLMERLDSHYVARVHGVERAEVVMVHRHVDVEEGAAGDGQSWAELRQFAATHDLSDPAHYAHVADHIDIDSHIDFTIAQLFSANMDWSAAGHNTRVWRQRGKRWRWMLFDVDAGFAYANVDRDLIERAAAQPLFAALRASESWRRRFGSRAADLLNTRLTAAAAIAAVDDIERALAPLMQDQIDRWHTPPSVDAWRAALADRRRFLRERPAALRAHIDRAFDLGGTATLEIAAVGPGAVHVGTTAHVVGDTPWRGTYFRRAPVTIAAVPAAGARFSHWDGIEGTAPELALDVDANTAVRAVFVAGSSSGGVRTGTIAAIAAVGSLLLLGGGALVRRRLNRRNSAT